MKKLTRNFLILLVAFLFILGITTAFVVPDAQPQDKWAYAWKALLGYETPAERVKYHIWREKEGAK